MLEQAAASRHLPPCGILVDKEGVWYYEGRAMIRRDIVRLFYEHLERDAVGNYVISMEGVRCRLEVEDTPFVVRRVTLVTDSRGRESFLLRLSDDTDEPLDPGTLVVGAENVLYCRVKNGAFPARFTRAAYYQLADHVEEECGRYVLVFNGRKYPIVNSSG